MQRTTIFSNGNFCVGLFRLPQREVARERDNAAQRRIKLFESLQVNVRQPLGSEPALLDPVRQLRDGCERDVFIFRRKRTWILLCANELIAHWEHFQSRQHGIPSGCRRKCRFQSNFARPSATFVQRCHVCAPA